MKNLPIVTLISIGAIFLTATPVLAAGAVMYREVKSNNLFECSTNRQIEHIWTGGNSTSYGSTHTLICLDGDRFVLELLSKHNIQHHCLGITKAGYPRHLLYVLWSKQLSVYR